MQTPHFEGMLHRFLALQERLATKKNIIVLALIYPIFPLVLLPMVTDTGSAPILDLYAFYNAEVVSLVLSQYDLYARESYIRGALTIDVIYPIYYSFSLSLVMSYVVRPRHPEISAVHGLRLLPFAMMLADFAENALLVIVISAWPELRETPANVAGYATLTKWTVLAATIVTALVMAIQNYFHFRALNSSGR